MVSTNPLISTKIQPPRLRANPVPRPRLVQRLQQAVHYRLTLLSAPAGAGKTTLLCNWLAEQNAAVSWLALDGDDNDPVRFWRYLTAALETCAPMNAVQSLLYAPHPPARELLIATFINALATISHEILFVLDDYHLIETASIHEDISALLQRMPSHFHLVIATRTVPSLPLSKLRAHGHLLEIQSAELSFSTTEATLFLNDSMGLALTPEDIVLLAQQSEGWITGLQLAALSLQQGGDTSHVMQPFISGQGYVLDYLADEVLSQQPREVQEFLVQTAILDRLSSSLCDAVTGRCDSRRLLERLEQANLFIIPLDDQRHWYRYHHLFADALRTHLRRTGENIIPELHIRASRWYASHNLLVEAVAHAIQAGQPEHTADMIEQAAAQLWFQGERQTIRGWLEALPHALLEQRPRLCLYQALIFIYTQRAFAEAERYLQQAEDQLSTAPSLQGLQGEIDTVRALIATLRGDHAYAIHCCNRALSSLPPHSSWRGQLFHTLGFSHHHCGDDQAAITYVNEGIHVCTAADDTTTLYNCYFLLAAIQHRQGQLRNAVKTAQLALNTLQHTYTASNVYIALSVIYYEWNMLDKALDYAQRCIDTGIQIENAQLTWLGNLHRARILYAQGAKEQALALFVQINQAGRKLNRERAMMSSVTFQAPFWLAEGRIDTVAALVQEHCLQIEDRHDPLYLSGYEVRVRLCLVRQDYTTAMQFINRIHGIADAHGWHIQVIQCLLLRAITLHAQGEVQQAVTVVRQALAQAEPEGYVRSIVDNGSFIKPLLQHLLASPDCHAKYTPSPDTLHNLITAIGETPAISPQGLEQRLHVELSSRERDVLLLLSAGCTDREIAQRLIIGASTVASHMKRIYRKLDVHSRTQAVARARMLKLL